MARATYCVQLSIPLFFCLLSIGVYTIFNYNRAEYTDVCTLLKDVQNLFTTFPDAKSIFLCDSTSTKRDVLGDCDCLKRTSLNSCTFRQLCILWRSPLKADQLTSAVRDVVSSSEFMFGSGSTEVVTHFMVKTTNGHTLLFSNWFQQDDGSWWFDKLPVESRSLVDSNGTFFIGKYQGWLKRAPALQLTGLLHVPANWRAFVGSLRSSRYVTCDSARAHEYHLREGRDISLDAERFRHHAWRLLAATVGALDSLNVSFWLSSGTCLGYYRQCDFVPYMGDVDIGVHIDSLQDFAGDERLPTIDHVVQAMAARRLRLVHWFGRVSDSLELSFRSPDDIKLDVFFFYRDGERRVWNGGTQARTGNKYRYDFPAFELCWTVFAELRVRVPCDTETYLHANYGPRWHVPQTSWDWKTSPANVRPAGTWSPHELHEVVRLLEP